MTEFLVPYTFIPGTKAKAQEVNGNFTACKDAINSKAEKQGDSTQKFSVANAEADEQAVNKAQFDSSTDDLIKKINVKSGSFCVRSGNITNGAADLLSYSGLSVSTKTGGSYAELIAVNAKGEEITLNEAKTVVIVPTKYSNIANLGTSISGGDYGASYISNCAFDTNELNFWASSQTSYQQLGVAYIGKNLGSTQTIDAIVIRNGNYVDASAMPSIILQISLNGSDWTTIQTVSLVEKYNVIYLSAPINAQYVRAVANGNISNAWWVYEFQLLQKKSSGTVYLGETQNIYLKTDGELEALIAPFTVGTLLPSSPVSNQVHYLTSIEPCQAKKYNGSEWEDYTGVPIGTVTILSGAVSAAITFPFNQNGYNINVKSRAITDLANISSVGKDLLCASTTFDVSKTVSKAWNTLYTATQNGYVRIRGRAHNTTRLNLTINSVVIYSAGTDMNAGTLWDDMKKIDKGDTYIATGGSDGQTLIFYSMKGAD